MFLISKLLHYDVEFFSLFSCLQLENGSDSQSTTSSAASSDAPRGATTEGAKGEGGGGGKIKKKFRKGKQDKKSKESSSNVSSASQKKSEQATIYFEEHITTVSVQLSPEQVATFGSTSQLLVDESISSAATIDSSANRDDFTATAKISECSLFLEGSTLCVIQWQKLCQQRQCIECLFY